MFKSLNALWPNWPCECKKSLSVVKMFSYQKPQCEHTKDLLMSVTGFPDLSYMQVFLHNLCIHCELSFILGLLMVLPYLLGLSYIGQTAQGSHQVKYHITATYCYMVLHTCHHGAGDGCHKHKAPNIVKELLWTIQPSHSQILHSHQTSSQKNIKPWRSWPLNGEIDWWNHSWFTAQTSNKCNFNIHYSCRLRLLLHIITNNEQRQSMPCHKPHWSKSKLPTPHHWQDRGKSTVIKPTKPGCILGLGQKRTGQVSREETIVLQFRFRCKITNSISRWHWFQISPLWVVVHLCIIGTDPSGSATWDILGPWTSLWIWNLLHAKILFPQENQQQCRGPTSDSINCKLYWHCAATYACLCLCAPHTVLVILVDVKLP